MSSTEISTVRLLDHRGQEIIAGPSEDSYLQRASLENPSTPLSDPDDFLFDALGASRSASGVRVSATTSLNHAAVWRANELLTTLVGKLPMGIFKKLPNGGKELDLSHPASRLVRRRPNSFMTPIVYKKLIMLHMLVEGNAYVFIIRDGAKPVELVPLRPDLTTPVLENGRLTYVTRLVLNDNMAESKLLRIDPSNILHFKRMSFDGIVGISTIRHMRETIGAGLASQDYSARFFSNNAQPNFILEAPFTMTDKTVKRFHKNWKRSFGGTENAHKTAILENGMKAHTISYSAKDSQLIESQTMSIRLIALFYGLPPHKLGDVSRAAFNTLEQENQSLLDDTVDGFLVAIEEEEEAKLLTERELETESHSIEFDRSSLVRADVKTKLDVVSRGVGGAPFMTVDEGRDMFQLNPTGEEEHTKVPRPLNLEQDDGNTGHEDDEEEEEEPDAVEETEEEEEEESNGQLLDVRNEGYNMGLNQTMTRMMRRLKTHAVRAASSREKLAVWVQTDFNRHREAIRGALEPYARMVSGGNPKVFDLNLKALETVLWEKCGDCIKTALLSDDLNLRTDLESLFDENVERMSNYAA